MNLEIKVERYLQNEYGIFGKLKLKKEGETILSCETLENRIISSESNCRHAIPDGKYFVRWHNSPRFQMKLLHIFNEQIPKKRYILIHSGNTIKDTEGCILVGEERTKQGISKSRSALISLLTLLPEDLSNVILHIKNNLEVEL